ncbi:alpha/beta hydrolase [Bombilactobacillus bombi]|uniref:alpha/beta hydrolase n=1 Tax=Bombilactobacillus bombi TaxID=1303590 RepID=UPI0015E607E5|nr:alpha/beta hydrolase [Bombilactobacillus bombi]MBA1434681.1 alpha/beta hydrolase [Bombilactobacillus bombi]
MRPIRRYTLLAMLALPVLSGAGLFNYVHRRDSSALKSKPRKFSKANLVVQGAQQFVQLPKKMVQITSFDGLLLTGWLTKNHQNRATVIIVHGFGVDHHSLDKIGYLFYQLGFNVLQPDNRAAGQSGGHYLSYGYLEKYDVLSWLNYLQQQPTLCSRVILFGASMGAATVLQSLQLQLPPNVCGVIADSSYTDAFAISKYTIKRQFKIPAGWLTHTLSMWSKILGQGSYHQASPLRSVSLAQVPLLFICGLKDSTVPPSMTQELYEAAGQPKFLATFAQGEHIRSIEAQPQKYQQTIQDFLQVCHC